eukprot:146968_1
MTMVQIMETIKKIMFIAALFKGNYCNQCCHFISNFIRHAYHPYRKIYIWLNILKSAMLAFYKGIYCKGKRGREGKGTSESQQIGKGDATRKGEAKENMVQQLLK